MRKKEMIAAIIVFGLIIALMIILWINNINKNEGNTDPVDQGQSNVIEEKYTETLTDGTKVNTSDKLKETKMIEELEIKGITITGKDNLSEIIATVENNTSEVKGGFEVILKVMDDNNNTIIELGGYIVEVQPGESGQLSVAGTADFTNAYDFEIIKK